MYNRILVPVENRKTDQTILRHIRQLAKLTNAKLTLVHVADGWAARNFEQFELQESEEMKQDRQYLAELSRELGSLSTVRAPAALPAGKRDGSIASSRWSSAARSSFSRTSWPERSRIRRSGVSAPREEIDEKNAQL